MGSIPMHFRHLFANFYFYRTYFFNLALIFYNLQLKFEPGLKNIYTIIVGLGKRMGPLFMVV